jgi:hypothetical protein
MHGLASHRIALGYLDHRRASLYFQHHSIRLLDHAQLPHTRGVSNINPRRTVARVSASNTVFSSVLGNFSLRYQGRRLRQRLPSPASCLRPGGTACIESEHLVPTNVHHQRPVRRSRAVTVPSMMPQPSSQPCRRLAHPGRPAKHSAGLALTADDQCVRGAERRLEKEEGWPAGVVVPLGRIGC